MDYVNYYQSPIGLLKILANSDFLTQVRFVEIKQSDYNPNKITEECIIQLDEYFNGKRVIFDIPINFLGTDFRIRVWKQLLKIPYGYTLSYKEIAIKTGCPKGYRAVGNANNKNLIPIIIPCHRVIGCNGNLIGYASGLDKKEWLLSFEKKNIEKNIRNF
ncbi:MAG TPA: methylated-DNA--[protein]-cysteine S-methyltransferase [Spirochaetota bacterium]|nr:methylated-DNA--[protein]-cysteine S-methyltransferase [Spirochaetota bacterium]